MNALNKLIVSVTVLNEKQKYDCVLYYLINSFEISFILLQPSYQLTLSLKYETERFHSEVCEFHFVAYDCVADFVHHAFGH